MYFMNMPLLRPKNVIINRRLRSRSIKVFLEYIINSYCQKKLLYLIIFSFNILKKKTKQELKLFYKIPKVKIRIINIFIK